MQITFKNKAKYRAWKRAMKARGFARGKDWSGGWTPDSTTVLSADQRMVSLISPRWVVSIAPRCVAATGGQ